ncbi:MULTISPECIES: nitrate reductase molybdenum cofactor assembly chaperone [Micrococcaceae]|uniref:nitrate reductase molybdenum cofactor assembly chaperone n=1 Tax=Micrococcaceae TaxID=1268 RepID=UPI00160974B0|nr:MULTISPECIES: nitrate reductase molybdenum cofactor assembly chaperone [Micrococcaceae]MBB5748258.1 nitrate reductase delta subunit [Micrococcus sp. TA1]HRO30558.1 nitrate reductase molybdenum cofactor assembly chaperone [Citricoccus sp.]HRO93460.1 nitrate reductase molybdenum cofactor assembly chaperone [Citricoccus sp.]
MRLLERLLGKPGRGSLDPEDFTDPDPVRSAVVRQAAAVLLSYPDEELLERIEPVRAALAEVGVEPALTQPLVDWLTARPLHEVQSDYVREYDLSRRHSLHLTYWTDGDTRRRGEALAAFKEVYRSHGCAPDDAELPDYLPLVLEFAARVSPDAGYELLQRYRPSLELLRLALRDDALPQQGIVALVCSTLPGPSPADKSAVQAMAGYGPPAETVGLDASDPRLLPFTPTSEGSGHGRR